MLLMGWSYQPNLNNIGGTCHGLADKPVPCLMQQQPYGIRYVTDGQSVYQYRPVWFGGVYNVSKDGVPLHSDQCNPKGSDHICLRTITFISDK